MGLKNDPLAYAVVGCAMRVHAGLGSGFLESAYGDAMEIELAKQGIPFEREGEIRVFYGGQPLATRYRADFLCGDGRCIVELKAVRALGNAEQAQVMHYLFATQAESAVLLNFGAASLQYDYFNRDAIESERKCRVVGEIEQFTKKQRLLPHDPSRRPHFFGNRSRNSD